MINFRNKILLPLSYLILWILIFLIPNKFIFGGDNEIRGWIIVISMFIVIPFYLFKILRINNLHYEVSKTIALGSAFLIFPWFIWKKAEAKNELRLHQKEIIGVINKSYSVERRKKPSVWSVQAQYVIDGKIYTTSRKEDKDRILIRGDSVTVIYSEITPEISEIKEIMEYYNE